MTEIHLPGFLSTPELEIRVHNMMREGHILWTDALGRPCPPDEAHAALMHPKTAEVVREALIRHAADRMTEEAHRVARACREKQREDFQRKWGSFSKCSLCGHAGPPHFAKLFHHPYMKDECGGEMVLTGYTPP